MTFSHPLNYYGGRLTSATFNLVKELTDVYATVDRNNHERARQRFPDIINVVREMGAIDLQGIHLFSDIILKIHDIHVIVDTKPTAGEPHIIILMTGMHGEVHGFRESGPRFCNTQWVQFCLLKTPEPWNGLITFEPSWMSGIMELLQLEIRAARSFPLHPVAKKHRNDYVQLCVRTLSVVAKRARSVPPSFTVRNVEIQGTQPVTGGGYADIYLGTLNKAPVCLKVLRLFANTSQGDFDEIAQNFCNEALVWKQLDHPNIAPFLGVSTDLFPTRRTFCLISPWMNNGNLIYFLNQRPEHDRHLCIKQIASGIEYLHSLQPKVIHGDIRGANVLVADDYRCCLSDFGLTLMKETQGFNAATAGGPRGSTRWMAPEMFNYTSSSSTRSRAIDIYAFASTVLEMCTLQMPFSDLGNDGAVMKAIFMGIKPSRPAQNIWMTDHLWSFLMMCWDSEPLRRPRASDILRHLALGSASSTTTPFSATVRPDLESTAQAKPPSFETPMSIQLETHVRPLYGANPFLTPPYYAPQIQKFMKRDFPVSSYPGLP